MESLAGHLLTASPQLLDENFARSLVFLIQHTDEGALGVVVNRPLKKTVRELWREVGSEPCHSRQPVYGGGPVPGPLMSLHSRPELADLEPAPGVFFAAQKAHLDALVLDEKPNYRYKVFLGNAGWGAGQLESELRQGAWRTLPAVAEHVFSTDETLWEQVFRQLGRMTMQSILNVKDLPPDPTVN